MVLFDLNTAHVVILILVAQLQIALNSKVDTTTTMQVTATSSDPDDTKWEDDHIVSMPDLEVEGQQRRFPKISIFRVLHHGCFDKDLTRFCSNRLTGYSCVYWTDFHAVERTNSYKSATEVETKLKKIGIDSSFFENLELSTGVGAIELDKIHKLWFSSNTSTPFNSQQSDDKKIGEKIHKKVDQALETKKMDVRSSKEKSAGDSLEDGQSDDSSSHSRMCSLFSGRPYSMTSAVKWTNRFALPVIAAVGIIGNLICTFVLFKIAQSNISICYILAGIAVTDLIILLIQATDLWIRSVSEINLTYSFIFACQACCQVYPMFFNFVSHFRSFLYIALAVDAYKLWSKPDSFLPKYSGERIGNCYILFAALLLTLNCQFLWTFSIVKIDDPMESNRGYMCDFYTKWIDTSYKSVVWPALDFFIGDILPLLVIFVYGIASKRLQRSDTNPWSVKETLCPFVYDVDVFIDVRKVSVLISLLAMPVILLGISLALVKFSIEASYFIEQKIHISLSGISFSTLLETRSNKSFFKRSDYEKIFEIINFLATYLQLTWESSKIFIYITRVPQFRLVLSKNIQRGRRALTIQTDTSFPLLNKHCDAGVRKESCEESQTLTSIDYC